MFITPCVLRVTCQVLHVTFVKIKEKVIVQIYIESLNLDKVVQLAWQRSLLNRATPPILSHLLEQNTSDFFFAFLTY